MRASFLAGLVVTILTFGLECLVIQSGAEILDYLSSMYIGIFVLGYICMWLLAIVVAGNAGLAVSYYVEEKVSGRKATIEGFLRTIA